MNFYQMMILACFEFVFLYALWFQPAIMEFDLIVQSP